MQLAKVSEEALGSSPQQTSTPLTKIRVKCEALNCGALLEVGELIREYMHRSVQEGKTMVYTHRFVREVSAGLLLGRLPSSICLAWIAFVLAGGNSS
jgi:hypothetical protein